MLKKSLKKLVRTLGYKISKLSSDKIFDDDVYNALASRIDNAEPILFDIGANHGQNINKMCLHFPKAKIHAFEPSKKIYNGLVKKYQQGNINISNVAVGNELGNLIFNEYSWDAMNSLLYRKFTTGKITNSYEVQVITLDEYCNQNKIEFIDFLKTDTEGFELNVLKGSKNLLKENKIKFIHVELFFEENFIGQSSAGDILNYLEQNNFNLVRFYDFSNTKKGIASKADALFVNLGYKN